MKWTKRHFSGKISESTLKHYFAMCKFPHDVWKVLFESLIEERKKADGYKRMLKEYTEARFQAKQNSNIKQILPKKPMPPQSKITLTKNSVLWISNAFTAEIAHSIWSTIFHYLIKEHREDFFRNAKSKTQLLFNDWFRKTIWQYERITDQVFTTSRPIILRSRVRTSTILSNTTITQTKSNETRRKVSRQDINRSQDKGKEKEGEEDRRDMEQSFIVL